MIKSFVSWDHAAPARYGMSCWRRRRCARALGTFSRECHGTLSKKVSMCQPRNLEETVKVGNCHFGAHMESGFYLVFGTN